MRFGWNVLIIHAKKFKYVNADISRGLVVCATYLCVPKAMNHFRSLREIRETS